MINEIDNLKKKGFFLLIMGWRLGALKAVVGIVTSLARKHGSPSAEQEFAIVAMAGANQPEVFAFHFRARYESCF